MKNKTIAHAHQEVEIYRDYYKSSFNLLPLFKSVLSVLLTGTSTVAQSRVPLRKRMIR